MASSSTLTLEQPPTPYELDADTSILIAQLGLDDIEEIISGKASDDTCLTDEEYAFQAQAESLRTFLGLLDDFRFAQSVDEALRSDQDYLGAVTAVEQAAEDDHQAAFALSRGEPLPERSLYQHTLEDPAFSLSETDESVTCAETLFSLAGPSYSVSGSTASQRIQCIICADDIMMADGDHKYDAPCGHHYCNVCLVNLVEACTRDESLFPLRCCQQTLPAKDLTPFLALNIRVLFLNKSVEFGTPSMSRVYCPNSTCSTFLGSSDDATRDICCPTCSTTVCLACKQRAHPGESCAENAITLEVKALARSQHWQTCPGCNAIVELIQGCYHMICRCGTQFCYGCGTPWKKCSC